MGLEKLGAGGGGSWAPSGWRRAPTHDTHRPQKQPAAATSPEIGVAVL